MKNHQKNDEQFVQGLKNIAKYTIENNNEEMLIQWWSNKYKLPKNHPLLMQYHMEELLVEYYQDQLLNKDSGSELPSEIIEEDEKWQGETSKEHEIAVKKKLAKEPKVDLSKYQTEESFKEIDEVFE